jgi:predicted N-acetyltransferase YhbS
VLKLEPLGPDAGVISQIASLLHAEWGHLTKWASKPAISAAYGQRASDPEKGVTYLAVEGSELVGSASLTMYELNDDASRKWWLSEVIVSPASRGLGVGKLLVKAVITHARCAGIEELFLYTVDQQDFYTRMGWTSIGQHNANGEANTIMQLSLRGPLAALGMD